MLDKGEVMYSLTYTSPGGEHFEMLEGGDKPTIVLDSLTGLVGEFEDTSVRSLGVPGARVDFRDRVVAPMTGGFSLVVQSAEQWAMARAAFSTHRYGTLTLDVGDVKRTAPVRLSASLPSPGGRPKMGSQIQVALVSDGPGGGVWSERLQAMTQSVTVTNYGDVPVWPEIAWSGAGGDVYLPSGASFRLPPVSGEHRVSLARGERGRVYGPAGFDKDLTRTAGAVGEATPVGESRVYRVPSGARLEWSVGVLDPWI